RRRVRAPGERADRDPPPLTGRQAGTAAAGARGARARRPRGPGPRRGDRRPGARGPGGAGGRGAGAVGDPAAQRVQVEADRGLMRKLQTQGVHHITIFGSGRQTSIDFWEGVLGMPFVFEQPNLDRESESHLYFDPGDGRLITIFTNEAREPDSTRTSTDTGAVHHIAFSVSQATFNQAVVRL